VQGNGILGRNGVEEPKGRWKILGHQLFGFASQRSLDDHNRIVIANPVEGVNGGLKCFISARMLLIPLSKRRLLQCHRKVANDFIRFVILTPFEGLKVKSYSVLPIMLRFSGRGKYVYRKFFLYAYFPAWENKPCSARLQL